MYLNVFGYLTSCLFVLLSHSAMLANIWFNGSFSELNDFVVLATAVIALDLVYFIAMPYFRQSSYTLDFLLILVLNMGVIVQSCFGGASLSVKHYITCIASLISCRFGFILCKNHKWIELQKKYVYLAIGVLMLVILLFTGSRSMWINFGSFSLQPSEFMKPLFVLACATSVAEQQKKHEILGFYVVYENFALFGLISAICLLQWWCRDLGSLPTFVCIYICGFLLRICYPKAKFSRKTLIIAGISLIAVALIAVKLAPEYVKARLFADIWNDTSGGGYQQSKALIAIADGGWFGKGPGNGFLHNVFAYESDIVFATISEEWGLLFVLMLVLAIVIMTAVTLINPPRSYFHATMATGVCSALLTQMALNIFGSCNLIPFTGVTVPFISAGGSSMVTSGFMIGMLIACQSPEFSNPKVKRRKSDEKH